MKRTIEIVSLTPKGSYTPQGMIGATIMAYKNETGNIEQRELFITQFDLMQMLGIKNLSDAYGRKYEMEIDDASGGIAWITAIDTRTYGFAEFNKMEVKINEILTFLQKRFPAESKPVDIPKPAASKPPDPK